MAGYCFRLRHFLHLPALDDDVEQARIAALVKGSIPHLFGGQLVPIFLFFVFYNQAEARVLWAWLLISLFAALISAFFIHTYMKDQSRFSARQWGRLIVVLLLTLALCRAAAPLLFIGSGSYIHDIVLVIMMLGTSTGGAIALAIFLPACVAFVLPVLGVLSWAVWQHDIANSGFLAVLALTYAALLLAQAVTMNRVLVSNIRLRIEYEKARAAMEQANASKARFLSAVSHDIRQPLQAVNLFVSAIENGSRSERNAELFESLKQSLDGMSTQLNHLLDVATLDEGGIKAYPQCVELRILLEKLYQRFVYMARQQGQNLQFVPCHVFVITDPELLERVLSNLLVNAIKHSGYNDVTLHAYAIGDGTVEICVEDNGPGIPEEQQADIFEAFYRLDHSLRDRATGSGLGLAIVKGFCDLLGHPLRLESEVGRGCRFYLQLPEAAAPALTTPPLTKRSVPWSLQNYRVMVLDDDADILLAMQSVLERWGCRVACASGLPQAQQLCQTDPPDILISDFDLGDGCNGIMAADVLKQQHPALLSLIISGELKHPLLASARQSGYLVLNKPVKPGELRMALQHLLMSQ